MSDSIDLDAIEDRRAALARTRSILRWIAIMVATITVGAYVTCDARSEYWKGFEQGERYCKPGKDASRREDAP